jgi:hypothetical protein
MLSSVKLGDCVERTSLPQKMSFPMFSIATVKWLKKSHCEQDTHACIGHKDEHTHKHTLVRTNRVQPREMKHMSIHMHIMKHRHLLEQ